MAVVTDIISAYNAPKAEMRRQIESDISEPQTLFYALTFGTLSFVSYLPQMARRAFEDDLSLSALAAAQFVASVFMMPLLVYGIAAIAHWALVKFQGQGDYIGARRAFFWAALVTSPLVLISSVINIFIPQLSLIAGLITGAVFFWQLFSNMKELEYPNV